jgi:hypothetical protein
MKRSLTRRNFLRGVGAAALAAPFMGYGNRAFAAAGSKAKYLFIMATPNGTIPDRIGTMGSGAGYSLETGSILEPLSPRKDDVLIFRGLDFKEASNHEGGMRAMLTGNGPISIDQKVAAAIGKDSPFGSLELGVMTSNWGASVQTRMVYKNDGFVHPDDSPASVYRRLFGSVTGNAEEVEYNLFQRRKSILDLASEELEEIDKQVANCGGEEQRQKLQAHKDSIREVEDRLTKQAQGQMMAGGGPAEACAPPMLGQVDPSSNDDFPAIGDAQMDLGIAAIGCGLTRVVTLQWTHTVSPVTFTWLDQSTGHHDLSHAMNQQYVDAERWFAQRFVDLLDKLDNTPDPVDPGSLLDHTLVLWSQELGHGSNHVCKDVPFVMAGASDVIEHGKLLSFNGEAHQRLLVAVGQAMGLTDQTFGKPQHTPGPLDGILKG